ncbi:TRAP transporter permease [Cereibacter sphaeroides]|uniref:TRAP transporter permease n=1 Tax=Cereibacter sphaeroides TaxID=1063 RepID=UPI00020B00EA|nr:TRAP transporter permease [Cereibacter sphaeroides]AZB57655.1 TRAP transporter fused permease subunit [Cereibacter sphaeroides]AZB61926.1 TRAP transporter fused permease subunit [Cereibacter sphaeroides]EGJ19684.1 TRAP-T family transporter with fused DctQ/DctM subunits [Cereibacter sphaeroides WS8N]SNT30604.1 TRAP transporter, 4TM/12TM fusion protein [[Luteovulum] sphaeroides subsp. megalophilum]GEM95196.1 C4-dicarboxylate ABC transporter [Cereibacter sphaeroides]
MTDETQPKSRSFTDEELQDLVASTDSGGRNPSNRTVAILIAATAFLWSLFQLWIAQPQLWFGQYLPVLNSSQTRPIHLTFAILLAFLAYPALKSSPRDRVPILDWVLALAGAGCAFYVFLYSRELAATARAGLPTQTQIVVGAVGIVLLLEASRRALGPALTVVGAIFLLYAWVGQGWLIPDIIAHSGLSFTSIVNAQWLDTNGVFGIPLGVSTAFVFLFVLFGALLDKAGAGNYFIQLAFAGLGALRGGPAKAAVVGSAMTGLISGSSIANVVTTGTFTIPLMKRVGFSSEKAGAVEVASSVNGQIMPPVMGAAAFLMVEFVGISYVEVIKHAFIPAVISYIALVYIVHLEALKQDMPALGPAANLGRMFAKIAVGFVVTGAAFTGLVWAIQALRGAAPGISDWIVMAVLGLAYVLMVRVSARRPDLALDDPNARQIRLPAVAEVFPTGLHYLLPILVLVWFLMIEMQSPGKSAFYAVAVMIFIIVTQRPLKALFRGEDVGQAFGAGFGDLIEGMIAGARNMIGIGVATAAAGIIVATVTKTPIGTELAGLVEMLSGGNLFIMLLLVGLFSLILGMGLPTTANYIVVSSLMASVVVSLGAQEGLIVPLIAAHLFVFYFGIMADVTPPVGLASFAAAAVSGGDPIRTGITAFFYSLRTAALPFLFIYNPTLILYGVDLGTWAGILQAVGVFAVATVAMLLFAAATQGYFLAPSRLWESAALLLVAFTLFVPGFWLDRILPRFEERPPTELAQAFDAAEPGETVRFVVQGPDFATGRPTRLTMVHTVEAEAPATGRAEAAGLLLLPEEGRLYMDEPMFGTDYQQKLQGFDFYGTERVEVSSLQSPAHRPPKQLFYIPALLLLGLVIALQRRRQTKPAF